MLNNAQKWKPLSLFCIKQICNRKSLLQNGRNLKSVGVVAGHRNNHCDTNEIRVRFAPSPTGSLHIGGLRTALYNYLFACKQRKLGRKASFILRIEDTDSTRFVPGSVESLKAVLTWAGIHCDEGPDEGGPYSPYVQSSRVNFYKEHAKQLVADGTAYYCFCSATRLDLVRKEAFRHGRTPGYDNKCRHLNVATSRRRVEHDGELACVRLRYDKAIPVDDVVFGKVAPTAVTEGDPVLLKQDGMPTYHFANVIDDHCMQITHVLRGAEWLTSTHKHLLLYEVFGWTPPKFAHLPLLLDLQGRKLSKRTHQDQVSVNAYIERGIYPEALLSFLCSSGAGFSQHSGHESDITNSNQRFDLSRRVYVATMQELVEHFELGMIRANPCRIAPLERALELNHMILLRKFEADPNAVKAEFEQLIKARDKPTIFQREDSNFDDDQIRRALEWGINTRKVCTLKELLDDENFATISDLKEARSTPLVSAPVVNDSVAQFLQGAILALSKFQSETDDTGVVATAALKKYVNTGQTFFTDRKTAWHLLRMAIIGKSEGAPIAELLHVLGVKTVIERLKLHVVRDVDEVVESASIEK